MADLPLAAGDVDLVARARALQALVRQHADQGEAQRRLAEPVVRALAAAGLYRAAAPASFGGADADPVTQIRIIEAISEADGSAGWNLMIGIESFGLIAPTFGPSAHLIADPAVVLCGSTANAGRADWVEGGFEISGQWQFVSGCHSSDLFAATVSFYRDGAPMPGQPPRAYALLTRGQFEILDTWDVAGLRGSGSHDVRVDRVVVPPERILGTLGSARGQSRLLDIPLGARLAYNKVGVSFGIARAAIDAFVDLATGKIPRFESQRLRERPDAQRAVARAEVLLRGSRALVFELVEEMWQTISRSERLSRAQRALIQAACSDAARRCVEAVDRIAEAAGTSANEASLPLARLVRDVRVVPQHVTVAPHHLQDAGRVLLGLEPKSVMLSGKGLHSGPG